MQIEDRQNKIVKLKELLNIAEHGLAPVENTPFNWYTRKKLTGSIP
jgi:hypothetical protein